MLTIQIEDAKLEQRIAKKAKAIGKSVQDFIKELVAENVIETDELSFEIPRLDVRQHAKVIQDELTEEEERELAQNPDVKPFAHISDAAKYVHDMRRKPRH
jgi:predicted nucleotidyltransferase